MIPKTTSSMSLFLSSSRQTGHFPIYSWDSTIRIGFI